MASASRENITPPRVPRQTPWITRFIKDMHGTNKLARRHSLGLLTAAVSYLCLFALCPLFILIVMARHFLLGGGVDPSETQAIQRLFEELFPSIATLVTDNLLNIASKNLATNLLSTLLLAWSTYELFTGLQVVFVKISTRGLERSLFWSHAIAVFCFCIVFGASCSVIVLTTAGTTLFQALIAAYFGTVPTLIIRPLLIGLALGFVVGGLTLLYKLMPTQEIRLRHALKASFLFLGFFALGRIFFQFYVGFFKTLNESVYGTFLSGLVILVWIYYLAKSFLFSAQYAIYLQDKEDG